MKTQKAKPKPIKRKPVKKSAGERFAHLERELQTLKKHFQELSEGVAFAVPINTLAPEPFVLKRPFQVIVQPSDGEFIASLFDANLCITGDTPEEAVDALKMIIVDAFDSYEENESILGPGPARQLAVLRELIERRV